MRGLQFLARGGIRFVESLIQRPRQSAALPAAALILLLLLAGCATTPKPGEEINVTIPRQPVEVSP